VNKNVISGDFVNELCLKIAARSDHLLEKALALLEILRIEPGGNSEQSVKCPKQSARLRSGPSIGLERNTNAIRLKTAGGVKQVITQLRDKTA
jgi:hypothetical protein